MKALHWPAIVFLLTKAPRTIPELARVVPCPRQSVVRAVALLEAEGLVVPREKRQGAMGKPAQVWEWAP